MSAVEKMVSWSGSKYQFDFDLWKFFTHTLFYFGVVVVAFYAVSLIKRAHNYIVTEVAVEQKKKES